MRLARAVVVLEEGSELRLAAALAELDIDAAAAAADALVTAELLTPGQPMRFVHSLMRRQSMINSHRVRGRRHTRVPPGCWPTRVQRLSTSRSNY